jgi:hypothetical protein
MILAVADYAEAEHARKNPLPPMPRELLWGIRSERWGLPHGAGWWTENALRFTRMTQAVYIYRAFWAWKSSKSWATFPSKNPDQWDAIQGVLALRKSGTDK